MVRCEECGQVCRGGERCPAWEESQAFYAAARERAARQEPVMTPEMAVLAYGIEERFAVEVADAMNCAVPGTFGHSQCGVCESHHTSRKVCGCRVEIDMGQEPVNAQEEA